MVTNKEKYKEICEREGLNIPLFMQFWWMETVCKGKKWDVALAYDGDRLAGAMPYLFGKKLGMTYILQPQLTQYSGPVYFYPEGCEAARLDFEKKTAQKLIEQINTLKPACFIQNFSSAITNWLPFYWAGFHQTTRYTYRLEDISDPQALFENFDREKRQRKIRRYEDTTTVRFDMSAEEFARFHNRYWQSKGQRDLLSEEFITRVCSTAVARGNGVIGGLYDEEGRLLMVRFVAYDSRCAYSLMSANDSNLHRSGHSETLMWKMLQYLSDKTKSFDFEGSMDEGVEYFYRSFGATQTPYFQIYKYSNPLIKLRVKN